MVPDMEPVATCAAATEMPSNKAGIESKNRFMTNLPRIVEIRASFVSARACLERPGFRYRCITSTRRLVLPLKSVLWRALYTSNLAASLEFAGISRLQALGSQARFATASGLRARARRGNVRD